MLIINKLLTYKMIFIGYNILKTDFDLTDDELKKGIYLNQIRKHPKYYTLFINYNSDIILSIIIYLKDKFTYKEQNLFLKNKFTEEELIKLGY